MAIIAIKGAPQRIGRFVVGRDWNFAGSGKEATHLAGLKDERLGK
jgi:hypothetical protein